MKKVAISELDRKMDEFSTQKNTTLIGHTIFSWINGWKGEEPTAYDFFNK